MSDNKDKKFSFSIRLEKHKLIGKVRWARTYEKIKIFHQLICNNLQEKINIILSRDIQEFDLEVDAMEIDQHFVEELMMLEPFGSGNYKPKLRIKNLVKIKSNLIIIYGLQF